MPMDNPGSKRIPGRGGSGRLSGWYDAGRGHRTQKREPCVPTTFGEGLKPDTMAGGPTLTDGPKNIGQEKKKITGGESLMKKGNVGKGALGQKQERRGSANDKNLLTLYGRGSTGKRQDDQLKCGITVKVTDGEINGGDLDPDLKLEKRRAHRKESWGFR